MTKKRIRVVFPLLISALLFMPIQVTLCRAAESTNTVVLKGKSKQPVAPAEKVESGMSTPLMIGIGVGVAALAGGAIALGSGGGGGDDGGTSSKVDPQKPPTSDMLVSAWKAAASQAGSGLTYTGVFHLFQGGGVAYDILVSDGEHLVGGGAWRLVGYALTIRTDHGSIYAGTLQPGNLTSVSLSSNTGWSLTLAR